MKKMLSFIVIAAAVCFSPKQVADKVCEALCAKDYDGGYSVKDSCYCIRATGKIKDFKTGRIKLDSETFFQPEPIAPKPVVEWHD